MPRMGCAAKTSSAATSKRLGLPIHFNPVILSKIPLFAALCVLRAFAVNYHADLRENTSRERIFASPPVEYSSRERSSSFGIAPTGM